MIHKILNILNPFSYICLNATSVTYTYSTGTTIVAAEHNTNNDDLEAAIDGIALTDLGVTASAAELNRNDGVTPGTVTASKTVVVDASKNISEFNNVGFAGTLTLGISAAISANSETITDDVLGYIHDLTSDAQTQIDAKPDSLSDLGVTVSAANINTTVGLLTNLQTLTNGATSNGNALHYHGHRYTETQTCTGSGGTTTFTHNLGYIPQFSWTKAVDGRWGVTTLSTTELIVTNYGVNSSMTFWCF